VKIILAVLLLTSAILVGFQYSLKYAAASDSMVSAGGNGSKWDSFTPSSVKIKTGDKVIWSNPMVVSEPHTVTFFKNQSDFAPPAVPYSIAKLTELNPLLPGQNMEPYVISDKNGTKLVIVDNARQFKPVAIDSSGNNVTYLDNNAIYNMIGTEKFVNSGWMWPKGLSPPGVLPISNFTVTFEKAGTYNYICSIHPWMTGIITVQ
jgi:plastocyanin